MTSSELGKDGGRDIRAGNDMGCEGAPCIIGGIQERLDEALCQAVKE